MTFFEVQQMEDFLRSLERHLELWMFETTEMKMLLAELNIIENKLQKAYSICGYPANHPDFLWMVDNLHHRTASCRSCIQERLKI